MNNDSKDSARFSHIVYELNSGFIADPSAVGMTWKSFGEFSSTFYIATKNLAETYLLLNGNQLMAGVPE